MRLFPPSISDSLSLMRHLSPARISNVIKLLTGFYVSQIFKRPVQTGKPFSISVEPTTSCNLRCPECVSGLRSFTRPTGMMEIALFKKIVDELSPELFYLILYFQGEPYLNKDIFEMVNYASRKKIYTATSTNAHYFSDDNARSTVESGLNRLIISLDGTSQKSYSKYRIGGDIEKVIDGTKNLMAWRKKLSSKIPYTILQFLVFKHNQHEVASVRKLGKELGVDDVWIKSAQVYDFEKGSDLIPDAVEYSRYSKTEENGHSLYQIKNKLYNHCWKMWHSCVITWDGRVVPCCFDKDAKYKLGSMAEKSFSQIWKDEQYNHFRKRLLNSRKEIDICSNCSEGTRVWI